MAFTQSGAVVIPNYGDPKLQRLVIAGVNIAPGVLAGDVHTVLGWVAQRFNDTVRPLQSGQCWGFAPRQIRGGSGWSNHASGTAIDLNSAQLPQGQWNLATSEIAACHAIVRASDNVVRWGGDFTGLSAVDQMHFEIAPGMVGSVAIRELVKSIIGTPKSLPAKEDDMELTDKVTGIRDPLANPIDQTYTVAQVYQKQVNYLGSLVNKMTRLEEKIDALASQIKSA